VNDKVHVLKVVFGGLSNDRQREFWRVFQRHIKHNEQLNIIWLRELITLRPYIAMLAKY
jgi:hypothetical protein